MLQILLDKLQTTYFPIHFNGKGVEVGGDYLNNLIKIVQLVNESFMNQVVI